MNVNLFQLIVKFLQVYAQIDLCNEEENRENYIKIEIFYNIIDSVIVIMPSMNYVNFFIFYGDICRWRNSKK